MNIKIKRILFITTTNVATNPRLYKEACLALDCGFSVTIIQFILGNWSDEISTALITDLKKRRTNQEVKVHLVNATRKSKLCWLYFSFLEKASRIIYPFLTKSLYLTAFAHSKRSAQIVKSFNIEQDKYHLICAHNLGALYPAAFFSDQMKVPFSFDIEDYHPEECISSNSMLEKQRRIFLMQKLIPKTSFYTSASPLIGQYSEKLVGHIEKHKVILNAFPKKEFNFSSNRSTSEDELSFVWFSQNISFGRGLEQFFDDLIRWWTNNTSAKVNVTIIGNMYPHFQEFMNAKIEGHKITTDIAIKHIPPISQSELHKKLAEFDIGIASEQINFDFNREICLTNKILAYAQAGLFILASNTKAQVDFLKSYKGIGIYNSYDRQSFSESLDFIWTNRVFIRNQKRIRLKLTEELSWENEASKLVDLWNKTLL